MLLVYGVLGLGSRCSIPSARHSGELMLACGLAAAKQPFCELFAAIRKDDANLERCTALRTAARKAFANAAVLYCLMAMNTQRVALSMHTNT